MRSRAFIYTDYMLFALRELYQQLESEHPEMEEGPIPFVFHDIMNHIGLPDNAIRFVMGETGSAIGEATEKTPVSCCSCNEAATALVIGIWGEPLLLCQEHAQLLETAKQEYPVAVETVE